MKKAFSFETFFPVGEWEKSRLMQAEPSCFNGMVRVHRYRITVEEIEEPKEVVASRLRELWQNEANSHNRQPLRKAAEKLGISLESEAPNGA